MSTLKADGIEAATGTNTDLTLAGKGTGVPDLAAGFKVGGTAGLPINNLRVGTDGELITWDASGDPAAVAVGTATHVLTSNGAGAAPTFQAAGGGAWTLIGTQVASASASIAQTGLSSTYDTYAIALSDMMPVDDNTTGYLKIGSSGGYATDYGYIGEKLYFDSATFGSNRSASSSDGIIIGGQVGNAAGEGVSAVGFLPQPGDATGRPRFCGSYVCMDSSTAAQVGGIWGAVNSVIVVDRVSFQFATGNITSGRMTVWGISHA